MADRMGDRPGNQGHGFRRWAVVMLWVWMVSRSVCVAHCHGVIFGGPVSISESSTVSHGCCSRAQSRTHTRTHTAAQTVLPGDASRTASETASNSGQPLAPSNSCPTHAVVQAVDPLDSLPIVGIPRSSTGSDPLDASGCGAIDLGVCLGAARPRFCGVCEPRWDRGFEPVQTLGAGLRSLAPPDIG
jgi:hypothetical protein